MIFPLLAVDIGNARMKIGVFDTIADDSLHEKKGTGTSLRSEPVPIFDSRLHFEYLRIGPVS